MLQNENVTGIYNKKSIHADIRLITNRRVDIKYTR